MVEVSETHKMVKVKAQVDDEGRLVLPPEVVSCYGLKPGVQVNIDERSSGLMKRIVLAALFLPAEVACGRKGLFNARN